MSREPWEIFRDEFLAAAPDDLDEAGAASWVAEVACKRVASLQYVLHDAKYWRGTAEDRRIFVEDLTAEVEVLRPKLGKAMGEIALLKARLAKLEAADGD